MSIATVGYFCYLCNDKNEIVQRKTALLNEAQHWKANKHLGRADVCFEEYEALKGEIVAKTAKIKEVGKLIKAKPVYGKDYSILAIEQKALFGYQTLADSPAKIKELAEQFIVESIILGNFDDKAP